MFDLPGEPPSTLADLQLALDWSVRRRIAFSDDRGIVEIAAEHLRLNLTNGVVEVDASTGGLPEHLKPPTLVADRTTGPRFEHFEVNARPLVIDVTGGGRLPLTIEIDGHNVSFDYGTDVDGHWVLAPAAGDVRATLSVSRDALIAVVKATTISEAAARGVTIDRVDARITSPDERTLLVEGEIAGSKKVAFFTPHFTIGFSMRLVAEVDDAGELVGRVREVDLKGDGAVMKLLLGLARPVIDRATRTPLPLADVLAMAGVQGLSVREVRVSAGEMLSLVAHLGDKSE